MIQKDIKRRLSSILEQIIFKPNELGTIKEKVNQFAQNLITPKALKQLILECRQRMHDDLVDYFSMYLEDLEKKISDNLAENSNGNGEVAKLKAELHEKNSLLEHISRRVVDLELKFRERFGDEVFDEESIQEEAPIHRSRQKLQELLAILFDSQGNEIRNEYRFVPAFMSVLDEWNEAEFGEEGGETLPERIADFGFPQNLQDGLIKVATIRSLIGHRRYETKKSDWTEVYKTFFMLICHLILEMSESVDNNQSIVIMQKFFAKNIHDKELLTIAEDAIHTFF